MQTPESPREGERRPPSATPIRHRRRRAPLAAARSRLALPGLAPPRLRARRGSVLAIILLLLGAVPVMAASPIDRPIRSLSVTDALADREQAAARGSRSMLRMAIEPDDSPREPVRSVPAPPPPRQLPQPQATSPQAKPKPPPEPEPAPEPTSEPEPEPAPEPPAAPTPIAGLTQQQMDHAATIVRVGQELGLPAQAYVIAIATALQESNLRALANPAYPESFNLPNDGSGYDHDSVGLFQQRPISGWGSVAECLDPEHSSRSFYQALQQVPGWHNLPVTVAAQTVQVSAFPDHYAKHEPLARQLVAALT